VRARLVAGSGGPVGTVAAVIDQLVLPPAVDRRISSAARRAVHDALDRLAPALSGRVLDLADQTTGDLARLDAAGERYDVVLSVCRLAAEDDPGPLLVLARRLLAEGGHLVFIEPSSPRGRRGATARMAGPALAAGAGWRTDRDVVALLRDHGLIIGDLHRRDLPATGWPMRLVLEGRAYAGPAPETGGPS
jgi:hypothetical protein